MEGNLALARAIARDCEAQERASRRHDAEVHQIGGEVVNVELMYERRSGERRSRLLPGSVGSATRRRRIFQHNNIQLSIYLLCVPFLLGRLALTLSDNVRSVRQLRKWEYVSEKDGTLSESLTREALFSFGPRG